MIQKKRGLIKMKFGSKEHTNYLEKYVNEPLRKEIEEKENELKKTKVLGSWKDYKTFWITKYYTRNIEDASEVLRVKFYRAKKIYEKIQGKIKIDCKAWIEGYCEGVRADNDTKDILLWLLRKNYFSEV